MGQYRRHFHICQECGAAFRAVRIDAKTCGEVCRRRHARTAARVKPAADALAAKVEAARAKGRAFLRIVDQGDDGEG